jgi:hypothetical protein
MEITVEALNKLIRCNEYHERIPDWGERAWIARGEDADVIYWDTGNSWCDILHVIPKVKDADQWLKWFFQKVIMFDENDEEWWKEDC